MTIPEFCKIGRDLEAAFLAVDGLDAYQIPPSVLPAGCPLYASVDLAGKIFSISPSTLRGMIRGNKDFPFVKIGGKIVVDVPAAYQWLHERRGEVVTCRE